ncbi:MAG: DUF4383 domain-containing protein [Solirubrobacterales bacterium]
MNNSASTGGDISRLYAVVAGVALVLGGVGGFFFDGSFGTGSQINGDEIFGTFITNGWNNLAHLVIGLVALGLAGRSPRAFALGGGIWLTALGVWGLSAADEGIGVLVSTFPIETSLSLLHLLLGLAGIAAYLGDGGGLPKVAAGRGPKLPNFKAGGRESRR